MSGMLGEFGKSAWIFTDDMPGLAEMDPVIRRAHVEMDDAFKAGYHSVYHVDRTRHEEIPDGEGMSESEIVTLPVLLWWNQIMARMAGMIAGIADRCPQDLFGPVMNNGADVATAAMSYRMQEILGREMEEMLRGMDEGSDQTPEG
jgi:hypothetical protein